MRVLVACEFSGIVRDAFIKKGHSAMSCDLLPTERLGPHYMGDVFDIIYQDWDLMVAFPPCTHLAVSGARWFKEKQADGRQRQGIDFFMALANAPVEKIALENPVGIMSTKWRKPDQIIQPWQFGHEAQKTTCIWLKGLQRLEKTNIVGKGKFITYASGKKMPKWYADLYGKGHERSKTFQGIANAMANQWGQVCIAGRLRG